MCRKPFVSISEENYPQLMELFKKNNYILSYKVLGYYKADKLELCFNDYSKDKVLDNPKDLFDFDITSKGSIPTYITKKGNDYQTLFGSKYSSTTSKDIGKCN